MSNNKKGVLKRNPRVQITVTRDLLNWIDKNIRLGVFRSRSNVIHMALIMYREDINKLSTIKRIGA